MFYRRMQDSMFLFILKDDSFLISFLQYYYSFTSSSSTITYSLVVAMTNIGATSKKMPGFWVLIIFLGPLLSTVTTGASSFVTPHPSLFKTSSQITIITGGGSKQMMNHDVSIGKKKTTDNSYYYSHKHSPFHLIRGGQQPNTKDTTAMHANISPISYFDNTPFVEYNQVMLIANGLGFLISLISGGSHAHLDLIGTGAFALASLPTLLSDIPRIQLSSACVALWGTKLASFLFFRALKLGTDKRLEDTLSTVNGTFGFWCLSLAWGVLCSLPHSLGTTSTYDMPLASSPCGIIGTSLFVVGFLIETIADLQKWTFKQNHPGKFCNVGLWSISQHPNFLGNLLLWSGIFVLNAPSLIEPAPATPLTLLQQLGRFKRLALAAVSPILMYRLFTGQADGSFSNTQEMAHKKYGSDPEFQKYIWNVPLIFPNPVQLFRKRSY